jgi:hypothetical protein
MSAQEFNAKKITFSADAAPANVEYLKSLGHATTSAQIRFLLAQGTSRALVAKALNKRYQHVRNVEITPIKKV